VSTNTNRDSIARDQDQNEDDLQDQTTTQNSLVTNRRIGTTDVLGLRLCAVNDKLVTMSRKCVARRWEEPQVDCQLSSLWLHATPAVDDRPLYIIYRPNCCVTVTRSLCFYFFAFCQRGRTEYWCHMATQWFTWVHSFICIRQQGP